MLAESVYSRERSSEGISDFAGASGMSRGDWWSVAATLIIGGIAYFIGGAKAACVAIVIGIGIALVLHFTRPKRIEHQEKFPERGDYYHSTSSSRTNPDGSMTFEARGARQIDQRPQLWEALGGKFKGLVREPVPIWGEWIYTFETKQYQWNIQHSSENASKLCAEYCKEAGRLLLAEPPFRKKFPEIAAVLDDGDRWLVAVREVAKSGNVTASNLRSSRPGKVIESQGGVIRDLPEASRLLCQMAVNGF